MNSVQSDERPRIVVGVDGFEPSTAALRWAIHQAKLTGAVVEAVTAWHTPAGTGLVPPEMGLNQHTPSGPPPAPASGGTAATPARRR
jgi:hypothetical protein